MSRTILAIPFDPIVLRDEGEIHPFPARPGFDPSGTWELTYRVIGARGYKTENFPLWVVTLKRTPVTTDRFQFECNITKVMQEAMVNELTAIAECTTALPASPVKWTHLSEHRDSLGNDLPDLRLKREGGVKNGRIKETIGTHSSHPDLRFPWTTEFLVFETVQRLPFSAGAPLKFDLFQDFSLVKKDHRLVYHGVTEYDLGEAGTHRLHRFDHIGAGILPFEYYLDEDHRLLLATSGNKAFILDEPERARDTVEALRLRQVRTFNFRRQNPV